MNATVLKTATFVILIPGDEGETVAQTMREHMNDLWVLAPQIYLPDVRGKAYFDAPPDVARDLDEKWQEVEPDATLTIFVMVHEEGLQEFVAGLSAEVVVGVPNARVRSLYLAQQTQDRPVCAVMDTDPKVVMEAAMQAYAGTSEELSAFVGYAFSDWWLDRPKPWESPRISEESGLEIISEDEAWASDAGALADTIARQMAGVDVEAWPDAQAPVATDPADDAQVGEADVFSELEELAAGAGTRGRKPELRGATPDEPLSPAPPASIEGDEAVAFEEIPQHIQRIPRDLQAEATADWLAQRGEPEGETAALGREPNGQTSVMPEAAEAANEAPLMPVAAPTPGPGGVPPLQALPQSPMSYVARAAWPAAPLVEEGPLARPVEPQAKRATRTTPPSPPVAQAPSRRFSVNLLDNAKGLLGKAVKLQRGQIKPSAELTQQLLAEAPVFVGVGQKKGGSGKTAAAAGAGVIGGIALVGRGAKAVLIDGNINNPSGWGSLGFEEDEQTRGATVDRYVDALNNDEVPPKPTWAQTPGLAAYRENKKRSTGYSAGDIRLLRDSLAKEYSLVIVDLPNTLPMANSAPGEVVMHWLERIDVAVVPIDSDPSTIDDAHEFIDEIEKVVKRRGDEGRPIPVIISYLVPPSGELRHAPAFKAALEELRERVEEIVEVPYDDKARLALWTKKSIPEVSPKLAQAYLNLTTAIARAAGRARLQG